jgi:hypothetical protein
VRDDEFKKYLITESKIKDDSFEFIDEKSSILNYCINLIEDVDYEEINIINEYFPNADSKLDAYYYSQDNQTINLYILDYDNEKNIGILDKNKLNKAIQQLSNIIEYSLSQSFTNVFEPTDNVFDLCELIVSQYKEDTIVINYISLNKKDLEINEPEIEIKNIPIKVRIYDIHELKNSYLSNFSENKILTLEKFGENIDAIKIFESTDFDVYLTSLRGIWLARLYKDDSVRLLEANVRAYLKKTSKVNSGIFNTIDISPNEFVAYNNGLTAVASDIEHDKNGNFIKIKSISNFQIVNGGQTTATLYEALKEKKVEELNNILVPTKITVIKNKDVSNMFINNISTYSNTQTAIKKSDPPSNLKYYVDLEQQSNKTFLESIDGIDFLCFFERTNGQYNTTKRRENNSKSFNRKYPTKNKFNKIQVAKSMISWDQLPHTVSMGNEKNFEYFNKIVKYQNIIIDEDYFKKLYGTVILFREIDKIVLKLKLSYKANVTTYTMSYLSYLTNKKINLVEIWNSQGLSNSLKNIIINLAPKIHNIIDNPVGRVVEPRMWARKKDCWNNVLDLNLEYNFESLVRVSQEFYENNESEVFINTKENFENIMIWNQLIIWNTIYKKLSHSQNNMLKTIKSYLEKGKSFTKKQKEYAIDIFLSSVNNGFNYEE